MFSLVTLFMAVSALSQTQLTGIVLDGEINSPLPGATVVIKGTTNGTSSDLDGKFALSSSVATGQVEVSFIGYQTQVVSFKGTGQNIDLGVISLNVDGNLLDDIVIMGVADIAKDRKTPVAVSTIKAAEIQEKLGSQEFPELLNTTPSVYASKGGGGFGDSRISIRGFDQKNIAVMVNGMPINDMENSSVYWSNWAGLSDVTSAMQVQRGLGSSKLAISSIGGTINVLTRTSEAREGGALSMGVGNDNYFKSLASYNTGILENGLSASVLLGHTFGDGYVQGTNFSGSNYFVGLGYKSKNDKHNLQFTFTGAPQTHSQRYSYVTLDQFIERGENGEPNRRYNADWGYLNGERYSARENYYHKPVMSLNYDWNINETTKLGTVVYGSWGRGGGGGLIGSIDGGINPKNGKPISYSPTNAEVRDEYGQLRMDDIVSYNRGVDNQFGGSVKGSSINEKYSGFTKMNSVNSHDWYGTVINLNKKLGESFTLDFGVDARTYKGYHFNNVSDFLGATGYKEMGNKNFANGYEVTNSYGSKVSYNPWASKNNDGVTQYNNDGNVRWYGGFTQLEYSKDNFTAFVQGAISNQDFQRVDHFVNKEDPGTYKDGTAKPEWKTSWKSILGGNVKGGVNYNIDDNHNVFGNVGYYSKQPFFNGVYINNTNVLNPDLMNEKIFGVELGYGFRSAVFNANVNVYRTSWEDRIERKSTSVTIVDANGVEKLQNANVQLNGLAQLHQGVEVDFNIRPTGSLTINGAFSYGDWTYTKDVSNATILDRDTNEVLLDANGNPMIKHLYLDGSKVGDAPQLTASLGVDYRIVGGLKVDGTFRFVDKLYSKIDVMASEKKDALGALELPSFNLFDLGLTYTMNVGKDKKNSVVFRANVNNVFDTIYISESNTSTRAGDKYATGESWKGIDTGNQVWFGTGRTWNATLRYNF
ncbi:Outer membrane receptor proteins, mostly Fe transport [Myroides guanonis]|uniref:Outer membrane receptor proteins, mostly Fe transport n=2 Tax=Myroides guanonis TaxID=1150112 RepID=A0A1I3MW10_9FLAO|nr:Outer membrane receptor proteins, mostly Fe transport [Myroides guanonis]